MLFGFLLGGFHLSYHNKETILFTINAIDHRIAGPAGKRANSLEQVAIETYPFGVRGGGGGLGFRV